MGESVKRALWMIYRIFGFVVFGAIYFFPIIAITKALDAISPRMEHSGFVMIVTVICVPVYLLIHHAIIPRLDPRLSSLDDRVRQLLKLPR